MTTTSTKQKTIPARDHRHFLELRSKGIGSSDAAAVMGVSKWKTPYELWLEKTGKKEPMSDNMLTRSGRKIESAIADYFEEESPHRVIKNTAKDYLVIHNQHDYIRVHPDREYFIGGDESGRFPLECKAKFYGDVDRDDLPIEWFVQLQYQMGTMERSQGSVAWMKFGWGVDFDWKEYFFNKEFYERMLNNVGEFWLNNVLKDIPPPAINSEDTIKMFPSHAKGKAIEATTEIETLYYSVKQLKEKSKEINGELDELTEQVKIFMEDAETLSIDGKRLFTWKKSKDGNEMLDLRKLLVEYPDVSAKLAQVILQHENEVNDCVKVRKGSRKLLQK